MDDHMCGRDHLSGDLTWRQAEMRGVMIFPMMQQLSLLEFSIFSASDQYAHRNAPVLIQGELRVRSFIATRT